LIKARESSAFGAEVLFYSTLQKNFSNKVILGYCRYGLALIRSQRCDLSALSATEMFLNNIC